MQQQSIKVSAGRSTPPFYRRMYVQLSILGAVALAFSLFLFSAYNVKVQSSFALDSMSNQAQTLTRNIANAAGNYMVAEDFSVVEELLLQSASYRDVMSIQVSDEQGRVIGHIVRNENNLPEARFDIASLKLPEVDEPSTLREENRIVSWYPIENGSIGWVRLEYSLEEILAVQDRIWRDGILAGTLAFVVSILLLLMFLKRPINAIENATEFAKRLYKATGETIPVERSTYEVEQLEYALNYAATRLHSANKDLSDMKHALDEHAIVGITDSDGRITYANDKFCEISQYPRGELLGNTYSILNSGIHGKDIYESLWNTIRDGHAWHAELCDKRKDGGLYWVDTTIIPFIDDNGKPYQFISIQTDITERKYAEEVNARLGRILDQSSNEIYVFDAASLHFVQVNIGAQHNIGYTRDELENMTPVDIKPAYTEEKFRDIIQPLIEGKKDSLYIETVHQRKDGSDYPVDIRLQYFSKENPPVFVAIIQDISERKEVEHKLRDYQEHLEEMVEERTNELQIANRELESFCYSVSHDLRAPLRSIDGFSQALVEDYKDKLDDLARDYLDRVRGSSQRMGELIDDLLNLSRVVRAEMKVSPVNLSGIAENIENRLREYDADRTVEFVIQEDMNTKGDERLLMAMLENLLGNAWKFTEKKQDARIEFGCKVTDKGKIFYVRDNGAGFDSAYVHKLFEPFQRLHSTQEFQGSGIGLATVNRIIRRHGGEVWAEGEVDKGATIYFMLE